MFRGDVEGLAMWELLAIAAGALLATYGILDQGVNLAGQQVDSGQQAHRPMTLVFMVAREGRVNVRLEASRGTSSDRLDSRLLVVGDDRHRVARLLLRGHGDPLQEFHLAINADGRDRCSSVSTLVHARISDIRWTHPANLDLTY
jgi:hypothetical protein